MIKTKGYAVRNAAEKFIPYHFERRAIGEKDVLIKISYCGVCHSDIHQVRNEWGNSLYPMVPGHEIVGEVKAVGSQVSTFKEGDLAGVGCLVDSCRTCASCQEHLEQFCQEGALLTYNNYERDGKTLIQGGYSDFIVVNEDFCLRIYKRHKTGKDNSAGKQKDIHFPICCPSERKRVYKRCERAES